MTENNSQTKKDGNGTNHLTGENSPYLLQHAKNPVNWYPWSSKAFEKAKEEDKPIFLSIGYSTCHWCHVMASESFEDEKVAKLMNTTFINIKVDREERPDLDKIYMTACQMLNQGRGGWPLTIIMTPGKKPFFAATYIPKHSRYNRLGMMDLIPRIRDFWEHQREKVMTVANNLTDNLELHQKIEVKNESLDADIINQAYETLEARYDTEEAGFGTAPKFPMPHHLLFLLRIWKYHNHPLALQIVQKTLDKMRLGGIYDHIGFGFHRYSTTRDWKIPHFEKMLYDQALLILAYTEAYQVTKKALYKNTVQEIITYVLRELKSTDGGFYTAQDADSEGEEGKYYLWTVKELQNILEEEEAELITNIYNLRNKGNFLDESTQERTGTNIFYLNKSLEEIATQQKMSPSILISKISTIRKTLLEYRQHRTAPFIDDKILTDWNGLLMAALATAGRVFDNKNYIDVAEETYTFIKNNLHDTTGRPLHSYRNGTANVQGNIDDYAFLILGLIKLYESTFNGTYLIDAYNYLNQAISMFWDNKSSSFFFTPHQTKQDNIIRNKEFHDGAIPSGNSQMMHNLVYIAKLTGKSKLLDMVTKMTHGLAKFVKNSPSNFTHLLSALNFYLQPSYELIIANNRKTTEVNDFLRDLNSKYLPNLVVILKTKEKNNETSIRSIVDYIKYYEPLEDMMTFYLCQNQKCQQPSTDPDQILEQIM